MRAARVPRPRHAMAGLLAVALLFATACGSAGESQSTGGGDKPFEGETIHFVVSFAPGGGYDLMARAIAPYLEKELGATVVVENEDGAGGLLAANQVFAAEPDGLTIGFFTGQGIAGAALGESSGARYELLDYTYITRLAADTRVMSTSPDSEYKTIQDVLDGTDLTWATAGTGAADHLDATVLTRVLGLDGKVVTGFDGSEATALAVTSGKVDLGSGSVSSKLASINAGEERPLMVIGRERLKDLPGVPPITSLDLDEKNMALAQAHNTLQEMGRMVWAPPGVPEDLRVALEDAFAAAAENPKFLAKMEKAQMVVDFTPGAKAKDVARSVMQVPDDYRSLLKKAYRGQ